MSLVHRRTKSEIEAAKKAELEAQLAEFSTPPGRQIMRTTGDLSRARSAEAKYLRERAEEEAIAKDRRERAFQRSKREREEINPVLIAERNDAEAKAKADNLARLLTEQSARQAREAQAILDNQERARQEALAREAEIERLGAQVKNAPSTPKPFVPALICPKCSRDMANHPNWCLGM
jgi:hypothetical protein